MVKEYIPGGRPAKSEKTIDYILIPEERTDDSVAKYWCVECKGDVEATKLEVHAQYIHRATMMRVTTKPQRLMNEVLSRD